MEEERTLKLYRVELTGFKERGAVGTLYGTPYVVEEDPTSAYEVVRSYLDRRGIGLKRNWELETITLLAEAVEVPDCRQVLYLPARYFKDASKVTRP